MYFLIYTSYAIHKNEDELKALLHQAREKNKHSSITGMLLYLNGIYIQLIEGTETEVKSLYRKIWQDKRHKDVVVLKDGVTAKRYYNDWSMGFKAISAEEMANEENYRCLNSPGKQNLDAILRVFELLNTRK